MSWVSNVFSAVFGSTGNGKSSLEIAADVYDNRNPGEITKHEMNIENLQAGDASQNGARQMKFQSHESWFDIFVDGINRAVRPFMTIWAFGILVGWWGEPEGFSTMDFMTKNIIWTIITFWFGSRILFKDIPNVIKTLRGK